MAAETLASNSHRHDDVTALIRHVAGRSHLSCALLILQLERHVILWNRAQKIQQVIGVEADLDIRPLIFARHALFALAGLYAGREDLHLAIGELHATRRRALIAELS